MVKLKVFFLKKKRLDLNKNTLTIFNSTLLSSTSRLHFDSGISLAFLKLIYNLDLDVNASVNFFFGQTSIYVTEAAL